MTSKSKSRDYDVHIITAHAANATAVIENHNPKTMRQNAGSERLRANPPDLRLSPAIASTTSETPLFPPDFFALSE